MKLRPEERERQSYEYQCNPKGDTMSEEQTIGTEEPRCECDDHPPVYTRRELDPWTCATEECAHGGHDGEPLYLHVPCLVEAGLEVYYHEGILCIRCGECYRDILLFEVASGEHTA